MGLSGTDSRKHGGRDFVHVPGQLPCSEGRDRCQVQRGQADCLQGLQVRRDQQVGRVLRQGGQEEGREAEERTAGEEGTWEEEREACREGRGGGRWYAQGAQSQGSSRSTSQGHLRPGGVEEILLQQ